jgi:hypothetical protein
MLDEWVLITNPENVSINKKLGGGDGTRTHDPQVEKHEPKQG